MFIGVKDIRELYRLHAARLEVWDNTVPVHQQSSAFAGHHRALTTKLSQMNARCESYLQEKDLHHAKAKVLTSLHNHWDGLTVFLARPEVAMDNNTAERALRGPVVGRKNSYGSGSVWSAPLAAMMLSVRQTVLLWDLNPHHWLSACLQACADHGGKSPTALSAFLPWKMTPERTQELAQPMPVALPPFASASQEMAEPEVVDTSSYLIRLVVFPNFRQMARGLYPDEAKRVGEELASPTGAETASSVAGACGLITPNAMMARCSSANILGWVNRIFT